MVMGRQAGSVRLFQSTPAPWTGGGRGGKEGDGERCEAAGTGKSEGKDLGVLTKIGKQRGMNNDEKEEDKRGKQERVRSELEIRKRNERRKRRNME